MSGTVAIVPGCDAQIGRPPCLKLIKDITDAVVKNFSVPAEAVMVEIVESEPTAKAKGGVLFSEMRR